MGVWLGEGGSKDNVGVKGKKLESIDDACRKGVKRDLVGVGIRIPFAPSIKWQLLETNMHYWQWTLHTEKELK